MYTANELVIAFSPQSKTSLHSQVAITFRTAGTFLHQWALGAAAYPTHNLQKYETEALSGDFHSDAIVAIERSLGTYSFEGELIQAQSLGRNEIGELQ